jgi:uncharacterized coiled-coil protein SlyX
MTKDSKPEPENNLVKDMMRAVVREELTPLYQKFKSVETRFNLLTDIRLHHLDTRLDRLEDRFAAFEERIETALQKLQAGIDKHTDPQKDT